MSLARRMTGDVTRRLIRFQLSTGSCKQSYCEVRRKQVNDVPYLCPMEYLSVDMVGHSPVVQYYLVVLKGKGFWNASVQGDAFHLERSLEQRKKDKIII